MLNVKTSILAAFGFALAGAPAALCQATLQLDLKAPGKAIPGHFAGLSFESAATLPDVNGNYPYFRASNTALVELFKTLGIRSLRVGGNTSDRPSVAIPGQADIDQVFGFAKAAGARVIYTLRLRDSTPAAVQGTAKYIMDRYAEQVDCLVVGNEPNVYEKTYPHYAEDLKRFYPAVLAVAPKAKFCGPSTTPGAGVWVSGYIEDFGKSPQTYAVTQHAYSGGNARKVTSPEEGRSLMLSQKFIDANQQLYDAFVPKAKAAGAKYRIEETNSFYNGGAKDVSNTFASALWALGDLYWWVKNDAEGINFHTGDQVAAGEIQTPCWYATFWNTHRGLEVHPIAYALAAFRLGASGSLIPATLTGAPDGVDAYASRTAGGEVIVTLINRNYGETAKPLDVVLALPAGFAHLSQMTLKAPKGDISAVQGETLGGAAIEANGGWKGRWTSVRAEGGKRASIRLDPASALVLKLSK
jgi:hypothetical protein